MSELTKNPVVIGGAAGLGGLFVGAMLATASLNDKIAQGVRTALEPALESIEGQGGGVDALAARLDSIEAAVGSNAGALGTLENTVAALGTQVQETVAGVSEQIGGQIEEKLSAMQEGIGATLAEASAAQTASLQSALSAVPATSAAETASVEPETSPETPSVAETDTLAQSGDAIGVGQTAVLADGAVRAFVQRLDTDAGVAVLSINGESRAVRAGESHVVRHAAGACQVGVSALSGSGVVIASDCDVPAGSADIGDAYAPGTVAMFSDGKLRVFVSGVVDGDARLAVNGLSVQRVSVGQTLEIDTGDGVCQLKVNGVRGSSVAMMGECG